jgi:hypothetical protein
MMINHLYQTLQTQRGGASGEIWSGMNMSEELPAAAPKLALHKSERIYSFGGVKFWGN